jgi:hypothetical protein
MRAAGPLCHCSLTLQRPYSCSCTLQELPPDTYQPSTPTDLFPDTALRSKRRCKISVYTHYNSSHLVNRHTVSTASLYPRSHCIYSTPIYATIHHSSSTIYNYILHHLLQYYCILHPLYSKSLPQPYWRSIPLIYPPTPFQLRDRAQLFFVGKQFPDKLFTYVFTKTTPLPKIFTHEAAIRSAWLFTTYCYSVKTH